MVQEYQAFKDTNSDILEHFRLLRLEREGMDLLDSGESRLKCTEVDKKKELESSNHFTSKMMRYVEIALLAD